MRNRNSGDAAGTRSVTVFGVAVGAWLVAASLFAQTTVVRPPWQAQVPDRQVAQITVGTTPLAVELAITPEERERGLGYRDGLEPGTGMLFLDTQARQQTFWMKGMRFCLDIIWIEGGVIQGAAENVCPDPDDIEDADRPTQKSPVPVSYVLEVPAGWMAANGVTTGTPVENLPYLVRTDEPQG